MKTTTITYMNFAKRIALAWMLLTIAVITHAQYTNYRTSSAIEVSEENLVVTSTAGQKVMLNVPIELTTLQCSTTITGQSDNAAFTITPLEVQSGSGSYSIVVNYTPRDNEYVDGVETANITLASTDISATATFQVKGRHLPQNFVIAAKEGNKWVALTADVETHTTQKAEPIAVDNQTTPTKATMASDKVQYQLMALETESRYAANGDAVHLYSTITKKVLNPYAESTTKVDLNTGNTHDGAEMNANNALFYEWQLVSEDLVHYTITNSNNKNGWENNRVLGYNIESGKWGTFATADNVNQDLFLLPVETTIQETDIEVMEWGTESMVLRLGGNMSATSLNFMLNGSTSSKNLTQIENSDLYKVSSITLTGDNCETMVIADGSNNGIIIRKPIIVSTEVSSQEYCPNCDVVVLNGGKLSASSTHVDFANIYVYPGGKLVLDGKSLGAKQQVYLRGGYSWLNQDTYALPEIYLNGHINFKGSNNIIYDYYIKPYKYYQFALPYTVSLGDVTDETRCEDFPVWVKHYNGALRAANAHATSWEYYNGNAFEEGKGYIIAAKPRQVDRVKNRPLSIIRFPLRNKELDHFESDFSVETQAHGIDGYKEGTVTANNVGWNFVGNPFLSPWKGDIGHKALKKHNDDKGQWDGSYDWDVSNVKYITVMSAESGSEYDQHVAIDIELKPFFPFFMQEAADGGKGTINFAATGRMKKAPIMLSAKTTCEAFVQFEIMADGEKDQTGMFIGEHYSDDIDFDDYEKMFGSSTDNTKLWLVHQDKRMAFEAMTETTAASPIALGYRAPQTGHYTFTINEDVSELEDVLAVYLTDHLAGVVDHDLLDEVYEFESESAIYNDNRFVVRVVLRNEAPGTTTDIEDIIGVHPDSELPHKFIFQNRMYIMRNGIIYDATGQQVSTIDK